MTVSNLNANPHCEHNHHLLSHPLCKEQSRLRRIANVAFHVLTLGIPLAIRRIIPCCFKVSASDSAAEEVQNQAVDSVKQARRTARAQLIEKTESDMEKAMAVKIAADGSVILKFLGSNLSNPLLDEMLERQYADLALGVHAIWAEYNLKLLGLARVGISKAKMYEVLDAFIEATPIIQNVKDFLLAQD